MKRGYLLPEGCKDLIDVSKSKAQAKASVPKASQPAPLPPITGEMTVPSQMTVTELAAALAQDPFRIIGDLRSIGVWVYLQRYHLDFDTISRVVRKYGFVAKRTD